MNFPIKSTYLIIGAALTLSACSQEDIPPRGDVESNRIVFSTSLPGLSSRAEVITADNLTHFFVTGFDRDDQTKVVGGIMQPLFENENVDTPAGVTQYSSPNCIWPDPGKESDVVTFFAFSPGPDEISGAELINMSRNGFFDYNFSGYTILDSIANQADFVTGWTTGTMADNLFSGVTIPFQHQLSRIQIKAWSEHQSCDIEIAGVRIGGIYKTANFHFTNDATGGHWGEHSNKGVVEYVYTKGDKVVSLLNGSASTSTEEGALSIMGRMHDDGNENCAMLIPSTNTAWDYANDRRNAKEQMYISVLLRVIDATPTAGTNPAEKVRFPYHDLSQGTGSPDVPVVYFAVDKATDAITTRLYKKDGSYYTDPECKTAYTLPASEEIKDFGWAALPVTGSWAQGKIYTYTLNYTLGVGLHEPVSTTSFPGAGDPIISDRVGLTYSVKEWNDGGGSDFVVPGS